jgi:hypothetical protein
METKAVDLSTLHPAFSAIRLSAADDFDLEWLCSLYSVTEVGDLSGVQLLANRRRKTKIAAVQFELSRLDGEGMRVLSETLDGLGLPVVPAATRHETAQLLTGAGMECAFSTRTQVQVAMRLKDDLVLEFVTLWSPDGVKDGVFSFYSLDHVVNGAPAADKPMVEGMLNGIDYYISLGLGYERE